MTQRCFRLIFSTGKHKNRHRHGDYPHAADLNQQQKDRLPEGRPIQGRVVDHQPGDAGSGRGGEQRVQKRRAAGAVGGAGKHQQKRPAQNQKKKAQKNDLRRRNPAVFEKGHDKPPACAAAAFPSGCKKEILDLE